MNQLFIEAFLIIGLNIPVFIELYKLVLKDKSLLVKVLTAAAYWGAAFATKTLAAFVIIIYLIAVYYRKQRDLESIEDTDVWHIDLASSIKVVLMTGAVRIGILLFHLVYIIILDKLVNYNIKPQDIITYYTNANIVFKLILAIEIVAVAPILEEYVFRYFLYGKVFMDRMPKALAMFFSAVLFTISHLNISGIPTFFGLGLFCAYLYSKKGYWAAVIAHAASNLITLLLI